MKEINEIKVENTFVTNRNLLVFHNVSCSDNIVERGHHIKKDISAIGEYLHISVTRGDGHLRNFCWVKLPPMLDLRFIPERIIDIEIIHKTINNKKQAFLKIPPGSPDWSLKITLPKGEIDKPIKENISIGDDEP